MKIRRFALAALALFALTAAAAPKTPKKKNTTAIMSKYLKIVFIFKTQLHNKDSNILIKIPPSQGSGQSVRLLLG